MFKSPQALNSLLWQPFSPLNAALNLCQLMRTALIYDNRFVEDAKTLVKLLLARV